MTKPLLKQVYIDERYYIYAWYNPDYKYDDIVQYAKIYITAALEMEILNLRV